MKKATENTGQKLPAENLEENSHNNSHSGEKELTVLNRMIEGTPFMMRWEKEKGYSWGMAGIKIGEWKETEEEMLNDIKKITWEKIIGVITIVVDATIKMKELQEKANNNKNYIKND